MAGNEKAKYNPVVAEILIRNVPEALRKAIRQRALDEDKSMNELLIELLQKAVTPRK